MGYFRVFWYKEQKMFLKKNRFLLESWRRHVLSVLLSVRWREGREKSDGRNRKVSIGYLVTSRWGWTDSETSMHELESVGRENGKYFNWQMDQGSNIRQQPLADLNQKFSFLENSRWNKLTLITSHDFAFILTEDPYLSNICTICKWWSSWCRIMYHQ